VGDDTESSNVNARECSTDLEDRERMTEKALGAIRQTGPASALEKCCGLADQINAELSQTRLDAFAVEELQAYLARAAAVLKKL
jgi:hypothetical protein